MIMETTYPPALMRPLRDVIGEAVAVSWCDVMPDSASGLLHVEYELERQGTAIEWLKVWSSNEWGYWDLVCEYWMHEHPFGTIGMSFAHGHNSAGLARYLDSIMQNQHMFKPPDDLLSLGLIQVYPPDALSTSDSDPKDRL